VTVLYAIQRDTFALVTRPGGAGQRLSSALRDSRQRALWWPAFDLLPPAELEPLRGLLEKLCEFDLVVFVSAAAVRGLVALNLCENWPAATRIGAVGASTLQLARSLLPGAEFARSIGPAADAPQGGSEALWEALQREGELPRQALIVRAETGREWLGDRLRHVGCRVEYASVYRRVMRVPNREQHAALAASLGVGDRLATIFTSSEAVAALDGQFADAPDTKASLRQGLALCSHPRIAQVLRAAGYDNVRECEPSAPAVLDAIVGACYRQPGPQLAEVGTG
jgi:uroporphyrinogen-III synthase